MFKKLWNINRFSPVLKRFLHYAYVWQSVYEQVYKADYQLINEFLFILDQNSLMTIFQIRFKWLCNLRTESSLIFNFQKL